MQTYDLLVIGSGPGGQRAAIQAAKSGKRVAVVEKRACIDEITMFGAALRAEQTGGQWRIGSLNP